MTLRVMIADDEPLARARMRRLLRDVEDVEIVAEAANGIDAAAIIRERRPDVVFLDIEMPGLDGFQVLGELDGKARPAIIFVTAYGQHAIRAFEAEALDYLLKPVNAARLQRALDRVRTQMDRSDVSDKLAAILRGLRGEQEPLERIAVRAKGKVTFVRAADVTYIEAAGNYARVHAGKESHLIRQTLSDLESRLDAKRFVRIHRSTIVAVDAIRELRPWFGGDAVVVLTDGTELTLSRTYRDRAAPRLGL